MESHGSELFNVNKMSKNGLVLMEEWPHLCLSIFSHDFSLQLEFKAYSSLHSWNLNMGLFSVYRYNAFLCFYLEYSNMLVFHGSGHIFMTHHLALKQMPQTREHSGFVMLVKQKIQAGRVNSEWFVFIVVQWQADEWGSLMPLESLKNIKFVVRQNHIDASPYVHRLRDAY